RSSLADPWSRSVVICSPSRMGWAVVWPVNCERLVTAPGITVSSGTLIVVNAPSLTRASSFEPAGMSCLATTTVVSPTAPVARCCTLRTYRNTAPVASTASASARTKTAAPRVFILVLLPLPSRVPSRCERSWPRAPHSRGQPDGPQPEVGTFGARLESARLGSLPGRDQADRVRIRSMRPAQPGDIGRGPVPLHLHVGDVLVPDPGDDVRARVELV